MENRKQSVRLLMQKERERRERLRRQAAALAACCVQQEQQKPQESEGAPPSPSVEREGLATKEPSSASPSQQFDQAASSAAGVPCASVKEELPPDFFDSTVCSSHAAVHDEPESHVGTALSTNAPAEAAQVVATEVATGAGESPALDGETECEVEAFAEEEEGVVFEIEEPDPSLLLPMHAQSPPDGAAVNSVHHEERVTRESEAACDETASSARDPTSAQLATHIATGAAESVSAETENRAGRATAETGMERREQAPPGKPSSSSSTSPAAAQAVAPSPVTAALLASATGDELRWYRPFDTAFHSELLHEEEQLAELQREAQIAAEKRAAAAREAASAAAAAAVAAAAAAVDDTGTSKKNEAVTGSSLGKRQLAKRKAAAEATAAAAAAAEAAAEAAAAAAAKRAAAGEALLGKARAAKAAKTAQQRENAAGEAAVPWGFFDDEEREADARGLTGPKRLQELLRRAEERRRDMAEDLQERKDDWLRYREDVRRFVHGVEEQVQDTCAYRLRVERLKQKRKEAAAGHEWSSAAGPGTTTDSLSPKVATGGTAAAAVDATTSQGASPTVTSDTPETCVTVEAGRAVTAGTDVNQDVKRGIKVKEEEPGGSTSEDICGPRRGSSGASHDTNSDNKVGPSPTGPPFQKAESNIKTVSPSGDAGLRVATKHEPVTGQTAAAPTAENPALERLQQAEAEQTGSVPAYTSPHEDEESESEEEEAEGFSGEEDDISWRAKSLLTHATVPDG